MMCIDYTAQRTCDHCGVYEWDALMGAFIHNKFFNVVVCDECNDALVEEQGEWEIAA